MKGTPLSTTSSPRSAERAGDACRAASHPGVRFHLAGWLGLAGLALLGLALLAGCGSGGSGPSSGSTGSTTRTASARFVIRWPAAAPARGRLIPAGTASVKINITNGPTLIATATVNAPPSGPGAQVTKQFDGLPLGTNGAPRTYVATAYAYSGTDGTGNLLASGSAPLTVSLQNTPTNPATTTITLGGIISVITIALVPTVPTSSASIVQGQIVQVVATARDALGNVVPLNPPATTVSWNSSNTSVATVTPVPDLNGGPPSVAQVMGGTVTGTTEITAHYTGTDATGSVDIVSQPFTITNTRTGGPVGTRFVYVANSSDNTLSAFSVNATTGALTLTTAAAPIVNPAPTGTNPVSVVVDPSGQFVYVVNSVSNTVSGFNIQDQLGGGVTPFGGFTGSPYAVGNNPVAAVVAAPNGALGQGFLYVVNSGSNTVSEFTIDQGSGLLHPIGAGTVASGPAGQAASPSAAAVYQPVGGGAPCLFVVNSGSNTVAAFSINPSTGALTAVTGPGGSVATGGNPRAVGVDSVGGSVYVVNEGDSTISEYTVNPATCELTPNAAAATTSGGTSPVSISVSGPIGGSRYAYVANRDANSVTIYQIRANGTLNLVGPQPLGAGASGPVSVAVDAVNKYLYVTNLLSNNVSVFSIAPDGTLSIVGIVASGTGPTAVASTIGASGSAVVTAQ